MLFAMHVADMKDLTASCVLVCMGWQLMLMLFGDPLKPDAHFLTFLS